MPSHIAASNATVSRSAVSPARSIRQAQRPQTAFDKLLQRLIAAGLPQGVDLLALWLRRLRDRHDLANLSQAQLRDVGLDPSFVRRESEKPFWQA
jgi:uncharacterized protein YjiS (DUF1127 family)